MKKFLMTIFTFGFLSSIVTTNIKLDSSVFSENKPTTFNQLYVLGDSLSDTGVLANTINFFNKSFSFGTPFYQNRSFSDGKLAVEILAEKFDLKLTPAWDFWNHIHVGNNYACAGAQTCKSSDFQRGLIINNFSIEKQTDVLLKQHKAINEQDLIFFGIGTNDLMSEVLNVSDEKKQKNIINNSIDNQISALKKLIDNGAKHILLMNSPDISVLPEYNNSTQKDKAKNISFDYYNLWNEKVTAFQKTKPDILKIFDLFKIFPEVLASFAADSNHNIRDAAITYQFPDFSSSDSFNVTYNVASGNISDYFFFDSVHPTAAVHATIGEKLYNLAKIW